MFWVLIGGMFACQDEKYENVFGVAPEQRRKEYFEQLRSTLINAENGWNMQYFLSENSRGYNLYATFDDSGNATLGAKSAYTGNVYKEYSSGYSVTMENGPVLAFSTYNDALHSFMNPDINLGTSADFEFIVFDLKDDTIRLKGKWLNAEILLVRLPAGTTGEEYIRRAEETQQLLFAEGSPDLILETEGNTYTFTEGSRLIFKIREADADTTITTPYIATADGFRLYKSLDAGGKKLRNFQFINNRNGLICIDPGVNAGFRPVADNILEFFQNSLSATASNVWKIDKDELGGVFAEVYAQIVDNCKDKYKEDFESLFFTYKKTRQSATLSFKSGGKFEGAFNFDVAPKEGTTNQVVFTNKNAADTNGNVYLKNIPGFDAFIGELGKDSYTISTESAMSVSVITFVQTSNPDNRFRVLLNN
jgi:hypothetical protein